MLKERALTVCGKGGGSYCVWTVEEMSNADCLVGRGS